MTGQDTSHAVMARRHEARDSRAPRYDPAVKAAVIDGYRTGRRAADLARDHGLRPTTVNKWLAREPSVVRRGREPPLDAGAACLRLPDRPTDADIPHTAAWLPSGSPHWGIVDGWQQRGLARVRIDGDRGVIMPTAAGRRVRGAAE